MAATAHTYSGSAHCTFIAAVSRHAPLFSQPSQSRRSAFFENFQTPFILQQSSTNKGPTFRLSSAHACRRPPRTRLFSEPSWSLLRGGGWSLGGRRDDRAARPPRDVGWSGAAGGPVHLRRHVHLRHVLRARIRQLHRLLVLVLTCLSLVFFSGPSI
jgi:hypothetical protein